MRVEIEVRGEPLRGKLIAIRNQRATIVIDGYEGSNTFDSSVIIEAGEHVPENKEEIGDYAPIVDE